MNQENLVKLEKSIQNLKDKTSKIYLLVQDTKGNAKASVAYIYNLGITLLNAGYNPVILHEKPDYYGVSDWLGGEYMELPHQAIEGNKLEIAPDDFIVLPELYGFIMEQIAKLPCGKIILSQAYDHVFETLNPGQTWSQFGFIKCITTTEKQKEYLSNIFRHVSFDILTPFISESFTPNTLPVKPFVAVHTRDQRDAVNLIKQFYIKYPQYRWITFRDMRGIVLDDFAKFLKESYLSVWVDDESSFGTYPLECMSSGTPVIGKIPNMKPEWLTEENGIWTYQFNDIVEIIANYTQNWLEDNISSTLYENMELTANRYNQKNKFETDVVSMFDEYFSVRSKSFSEQLEKINVTEENK